MTTIISIQPRTGGPRHCDAHCYNAIRPRCNCVCTGVNHGVGLEIALQNNREWRDQDRQRMIDACDATAPPIISTHMTLRDQLAHEIQRRTHHGTLDTSAAKPHD